MCSSAIVFLVYAAWRAVRLGRPVPETQPVEIAGSELVGAAGRLLERGRSAGTVGGGAPRPPATIGGQRASAFRPSAPPSTLAEVIVDRTGADPEVVRLADRRRSPSRSDDELVAVARAVAKVHQEVLH